MALKSDLFRQRIFPKSYWEEKVKSLEFGIEIDKILLRDLYYELKKNSLIAPIEVAQGVNFATIAGIDTSEARKMAIENIKIEREDLLSELKELKNNLKEDEAALKKVQEKLAIYR